MSSLRRQLLVVMTCLLILIATIGDVTAHQQSTDSQFPPFSKFDAPNEHWTTSLSEDSSPNLHVNTSLGVTIKTHGDEDRELEIVEEPNRFRRSVAVSVGLRSKVVNIRSSRPISNATITFSLDDEEIHSDLVVYRFNSERQTFVALNSTQNPRVATVSAKTDELGTFAVLSKSVWDTQFEDEGSPSGDVILNNLSTESFHSQIIYLPQAESLILELTGVESTATPSNTASIELVGDSDELQIYGPNTQPVSTAGQVSVDISHFSGQQVTLALNTNSDSHLSVEAIRLVVDTDGDGLNDTRERIGIPTGVGVTLYTDPSSSDTDGDGLSDGDEVANVVSGSEGIYYLLTSNPRAFDSDGDGLSDYTERLESFTISRTTNAVSSRGAMYYQKSPDKSRQYLETFDTTPTDPLELDTDGDLLSDYSEWVVGTDPTAPDTDGDGLTDEYELQLETDPTIFDYQGPKVTRVSVEKRYRWLKFKKDYTIKYVVFDEARVQHTAIVDGQLVYGYQQYSQPPLVKYVKTTVVVPIHRTPRLEISATDLNGNRMTTVDLSDPSTSDTREDDSLAYYLLDGAYYEGILNGIVGFAVESLIEDPAELYRFVSGAFEDPLETGRELRETWSILTDRISLELISEALAASLEDGQAKYNSHAEGTQSYQAFSEGWKLGYVVFLVGVTVFTGGAAGTAKSGARGTGKVARASEAVSSADDVVGATKVLQRAGNTASSIVESLPVVGSRYQVWQLQRKLSVETLVDLSETDPKRISQFIRLGGDDGVEALEAHQSVRRLLSHSDSAIEPELQTQAALGVARASRHPDVTPEDVDRVATLLLDTKTDQEMLYRLVATDGPEATSVRYLARVQRTDLDGLVTLSSRANLGDEELQRIVRTLGENGADAPFFELENSFDELGTISRTQDTTVIDGIRHDTAVTVRYADDGDDYLRTTGRMPDADLSKLSNKEKGHLVEIEIAPRLLEQKGYTVLYSARHGRKGVTDSGIDLIARDSAGEIIVVETKYTSTRTGVGKDLFYSTRRTDTGESVGQMSDPWIRSAFDEIPHDEVALGAYDDVSRAINSGTYRKEAVIVQATESGHTITPSMRALEFDRVELVKLGIVA
ncbi:hypothetical protein [Halogranum rubrum]|uniref:Uncharacterized protein n=1 Tax=Halogranum salarium B-1 TaxID=1210908 RepID=J3JDS9_9EURY|nr:hypothetical protein [Halogranum salarium]EJN57754.1 hypothetical protein HSB1_39020 [Halogranum salarium B-1]